MPTTVVEPEVVEETRLEPPYNVVLLDDQHHTYEYVVEMLGKLFGYGSEKAFKMAREVDTSGRVIVWTGSLERAEFHRDRIHGYGKDWRIAECAGSMSAVIEPVEG